jgi:hypothetical protein
MKLKSIVSIVISVLLFFPLPLFGLVIGSNTLVSLESFVTFPQIVLIGDNEILSFAWMKNGFGLQNSSTELIFSSLNPVQGTVNLNGGTLTLETDLVFKNTTNLTGLGVVVGNGHMMHLSSSISSLPTNAESFEDTVLFFDGDLSINSAITFIGDNVINGNTNPLVLDTNAEIIIDSNSTLHLQDLEINGIAGTKIRCLDDTAAILLDNVHWVQQGTFNFNTGSITFEKLVEFSGTGTFSYKSGETSTINAHSQVIFKDGVVLEIGRDTQSLNEPLSFTDETSVLALDNTDFIATEAGITLSKGTIVLDRAVNFESVSTDTQNGILMGTAQSEDDIRIRLNPGCRVVHKSGYWIYNNGNPNRFEANALSAAIVRGLDSKIKLQESLNILKQTLEISSNLVAPVEITSGKSLAYEDTHIILPDIEFDITADQLNAFVYELNGNDDLFFSKGSMPLSVSVRNTGNVIRGNGNIDGLLSLEPFADVGIGILGAMRNSIALNEGKLNLLGPLMLDENGIINGPGTVSLSSYNISLSPLLSDWITPICWQGSYSVIDLVSPISLHQTWTISGDITINGDKNSFTLQDDAKLVIDSDSKLTLKNTTLIGVNADSLVFMGDTSKLALLNTELIFDEDYTFTNGKLSFERFCCFAGPYTIGLDQNATATVKSDSDLLVTEGATLSLGRSALNSLEALYFQDESAQLRLNNANVVITSQGATFTRGKIICEKEVSFSFNSTHTGNGMQIGDGTPDGDIIIQLNPAAKVSLNTGHILQNIYDINKGFVGLSTSVELLLNAGLFIHYSRDGLLQNLSVILTPPALTTFDPGVDVFLNNVKALTPYGSALLSGRRKDVQVIALEGTDSLEILTGNYPSPIFISGVNNLLKGSGNMIGLTTLENSSAVLIVALSGILGNTINLNGGTAVLQGELKLGNGVSLTGPGTTNLQSYFIELGAQQLTWPTSCLWIGSGGGIGLHAATSLLSTWTIQGDVTIKGHSYSLNLKNDAAQLVINPNSTLRFENIKLKGFGDQKIIFADESSQLIFNDAICELDSDFTMTQGSFQVLGKTILRGHGHVFAYESDSTSTVMSESMFKFDPNMTFSYFPQSEQINLIEFEDSSAQLMLDNSSIKAGIGGIQLMKGMLYVRGNSSCSIDMIRTATGLLINNGLTLGNDSIDDDCSLLIESGAQLKITQGSLNYRNIGSAALIMENINSSLLIAQDVILRLFQDMALSMGRCYLERGGQIKRINGKKIIGSVFVI